MNKCQRPYSWQQFDNACAELHPLHPCLVYKLQKGYIEQDKQAPVLSYPTYPELFFQLW